jgi:hypothetical protein
VDLAIHNDKSGSSARQVFQGLLHQPFGVRIERGGGFIQNEDRGVLQQGPRDADWPLFTPVARCCLFEKRPGRRIALSKSMMHWGYPTDLEKFKKPSPDQPLQLYRAK